MTETLVNRYATADAVAIAAAEAGIARIVELQAGLDRVDIAITGGTVGIKTLACWAANARRADIDYDRLHIWWGDERFVAADSSDRNFVQAWDALLSQLPIAAKNLHQFPAADAGMDLDEAAVAFLQHWRAEAPVIQFAYMGMGPDGHVASLFPGHESLGASASVIAEHDSPKPPAARLSFGYDAICAFKEIWFTVAGADKAEAVSVAFSGEPERLPVGRIHGAERDVWFIDDSAASMLG